MKTVTIPKGTKNCLTYLLEKRIDIERQCLQGHCGSCRTKLIEGEVAYHPEPIAWLNDDEFTPCCASAITDIKIEIDD